MVAFAFEADHGELSAVSVEALDVEGRRCSPRWRRTFGTKSGAVFAARNEPGGVAILVEGEADALAESLALPNVAAVLATGGTATFAAVALREAPRRAALELVADDDAAGRLAAREATRMVREAGFPTPTRRTARPDAAAELAEEVREREAICWYRRGDSEPEDRAGDLRGAWTGYLEATGRFP